MPYMDLRGCAFVATDLRGAFFPNTDLRGAVFFQAKLMEADFSEAQLDGATFGQCDLTGASRLTVDQLKVAEVDETTKLPDHISREALGQSAAAQAEAPPS